MKLSLSDRKFHELEVRKYVEPLMPMTNFHTLIFLRHCAIEKSTLPLIHDYIKNRNWFRLWWLRNDWKENRSGWPTSELLELYLLIDKSGRFWILGLFLIGETDNFHVQFFEQVTPFRHKWFLGHTVIFSPDLPPNPLID